MTTSLSSLNIGEQFEIPSLASLFRQMTVLRQSPCSVLVAGQMRDDPSASWISKNTSMAASTSVRPTGIIVEVKQNGEGRAQIASEQSHTRGRRSKHGPINFPDTEFKIKDLAASLELDYQTVMNSFNKVRDNYKVVRTEPNGGRGKPITVWKKK